VEDDVVFEVQTVVGVTVTLTRATWDDICQRKHREMSGRLAEVQMTVTNPEEIRRSTSNQLVHLFYRVQGSKRFICVVARSSGPNRAAVATAYLSTRVKPGEQVWPT
jgi:hypothetical protein